MRTVTRVKARWWVLAVGLICAGAALYPTATEASDTSLPGYVALGDSIDFGVGATNFFGYVPQFADYLEGGLGDVDLHNLSEPGANARAIAFNQLVPAIAEIQNHRPFGVVVSWGGGGNDLLEFITSPQAASCLQMPSCLARVNALLNEVEQTVNLTIKTLRLFAGPESPILVRTLYNSLLKPGCDPIGQQAALGNAALEGLPGTILDQGLNDRLRAIAARHGAKVIEIFDAFFDDPSLIAADCIHPTDAGHAVILQAAILAFEGN